MSPVVYFNNLTSREQHILCSLSMITKPFMKLYLTGEKKVPIRVVEQVSLHSQDRVTIKDWVNVSS